MRYGTNKNTDTLHIVRYTRYGRSLKRGLCGHKIDHSFAATSNYSGPTCLTCESAYDRERSKEFG